MQSNKLAATKLQSSNEIKKGHSFTNPQSTSRTLLSCFCLPHKKIMTDDINLGREMPNIMNLFSQVISISLKLIRGIQ